MPALASSLHGPDVFPGAPARPWPGEWTLCWLWAGRTADLAGPSAACPQPLARASWRAVWGQRLERPRAGVPVQDLRVLRPGLWGPVGLEVGVGPARVAVSPRAPRACCPSGWPLGGSWRQGCVCPAILPAVWPRACPACPFSLECSAGSRPPPPLPCPRCSRQSRLPASRAGLGTRGSPSVGSGPGSPKVNPGGLQGPQDWQPVGWAPVEPDQGAARCTVWGHLPP